MSKWIKFSLKLFIITSNTLLLAADLQNNEWINGITAIRCSASSSLIESTNHLSSRDQGYARIDNGDQKFDVSNWTLKEPERTYRVSKNGKACFDLQFRNKMKRFCFSYTDLKNFEGLVNSHIFIIQESLIANGFILNKESIKLLGINFINQSLEQRTEYLTCEILSNSDPS